MLKRTIEDAISKYLKGNENKILFVWGPRRSGKTTLINKLAQELGVTKFNFDLQSDREKFSSRREVLETIVKENKVILIDEIQNYPEATVMLKILFDEFKTKVIATGSSELRQKFSKEFDTLAGRFNEIYCLPLSVVEALENIRPKVSEMGEFKTKLAKKLQIYGAYPEVYAKDNLSEKERIDLLQHMLDAYVLKDVIDIYDLKNTKLAKDILTKIALQLGSEVSVREIADSLGASPSTVSNYIEIFIKNYILISLPSFKTNIRKAVSENRKLYFYDLGIRNILIQDFRDLDIRQDKGGVFENFIISELEKIRKLQNAKINMYFYREYGGKEVDIVIEDYKKNYTTIEIKSKNGVAKKIFPIPNIPEIVTSQNYLEKIVDVLKGK
ncbi:MAG: AAA ATPase [Candidatus Gottesmanbacteria bacterium GW2011_GWA1_47_8]|nr:MAG: AAA ATPase [Candidatus Gottesmanbacteria bacterium GW2011_GWA1_47_8]